ASPGLPGEAGAAAALALLWLLLCAPGDASCRFLTVASPLDRVTRHPGRIHSLSTENHFPPRDNELGKPARKCHTSGMLIPNGKEYPQRIPHPFDFVVAVSVEQKLRNP
uniref:Uncharacterized protein n=1 Tax=Amazona collaria TaxID=241587 RepID=A0A8B9G295_9PSIT